MTGLEKMIAQIRDDAAKEVSAILAKAKEKSDDILAAASEDAQKIAGEIARKSETDIESYRKRAESSAELKKRTAILEAKQEVIAEVLEEAYEAMCREDTASYFARIERMLQTYAQAKDGEIYFSEADLARMPEGFPAKIEDAAATAGGALHLSEKGADIENGFVLVYGGVEENCTLRAVFDANKDALTDKVHRLLYA